MSQEIAERGFLDRSARKRVSGRLNRLYSSRSGNIKEDDLSTARSKLDNILDRISRGEETFDDDYFDDGPFGMHSPIKSKRSRVPRKTAKKPREDEYSKSSSFILRLFDRTVDLSDFCNKYSDTDPPLYPICRAWARNCDLSNEQDSVDEDQAASNDLESLGLGDPEKPTGLYVLPPPDPKPTDDNGNEIDLRLPKSSTIKKGLCTNLIDKSLNSMTDKNREALLDASLPRWRAIRQEWREASFLNQERYRPSFTVIQALSTVPSQALDEEMLSNM